jgi:hypothetical protein
MKRDAWGVTENGELWPCAYETVMDAAKELADRVCELSNMPREAKGAKTEWVFRIIKVSVSTGGLK